MIEAAPEITNIPDVPGKKESKKKKDMVIAI